VQTGAWNSLRTEPGTGSVRAVNFPRMQCVVAPSGAARRLHIGGLG